MKPPKTIQIATIGIVGIVASSLAENPSELYPRPIERTQEILAYLGIYHQAYNELQIKQPATLPGSFDIVDLEDHVLTRINLETIEDRSLFSLIASLLLEVENPSLPEPTLQALEIAWYWDAHSRGNPAIFDKLSRHFFDESDTGQIKQEAISFFRYRLLMEQFGGRRGLWKTISKTPEILNCLQPHKYLSIEKTLQLHELILYKLSPVRDYTHSQNLLTQLNQFRFKPQVSSGVQWLPIAKIPLNAMKTDAFMKELRRRVAIIKAQLPSLNPLYANSIQSLGVCFERLIDEDPHGFEIALQRYLNDLRFTEDVIRKIENP